MSGYDEALRTISLDVDATLGIYTGISGQPGSAVPNYGKMYHFVKVNGKHQVGLCVSATDKTLAGILQNKPQKPGAAGTVAIGGVSNLMAGGTIAAGDLVAPDAAGKGVTDNTNGKWLALEPATSGTVFAVLKV